MKIYKQGEIIQFVPDVFSDLRGFFMETYREDVFRDLGIPAFVQDNHSRSKKDVIRGLHYQPGMGKLMRVTRGSAMLVALNLKTGFPDLCFVSEENHRMVWAPDHYARGFCALTNDVEVQYKCTALYDPKTEGAIRWDSVGIQWPILNPLVSVKDSQAPTFEDWQRG
jgi:dTDP-4-dehydrorhamnose 3,5-epimerase